MAQLPDLYCWIKLINDSNGKVLPDGVQVYSGTKVIVRYVIANDSHKVAGPAFIVGYLKKDGVQVKPGGKPVVPSQQITLQPDQIWKSEFTVTEPGSSEYVATMLGDSMMGASMVTEEDEANNQARKTFTFVAKPPA